MKGSNINILIANFFLGLSFLVDGFNKILLVMVGLVWFIGYIIIFRSEHRLMDSKFKLEKAKIDLEQQRFDVLIDSINRIDERRKRRK